MSAKKPGRPKLGGTETRPIALKLDADDLRQIDDWRFANRANSRSEAIRNLIQLGIRASQGRQK